LNVIEVSCINGKAFFSLPGFKRKKMDMRVITQSLGNPYISYVLS